MSHGSGDRTEQSHLGQGVEKEHGDQLAAAGVGGGERGHQEGAGVGVQRQQTGHRHRVEGGHARVGRPHLDTRQAVGVAEVEEGHLHHQEGGEAAEWLWNLAKDWEQ